MSRIECSTLTRTRQIAQERGFLKKRQELTCPYLGECDGKTCQWSKKGEWRTIFLYQKGEPDVPVNSLDRFYLKAEKSLDKIRSRRKARH